MFCFDVLFVENTLLAEPLRSFLDKGLKSQLSVANLRTNFVATIFVSSVPSAVNTVNIIFHYNLFNFAARKNIDLVWWDSGACSNFISCCIPLSRKHRSDGGRNTPYGVPVAEASIPSKSSGALND